ncbi:MAG: YqgE/AlgH family protein [Polyangiaceae bacterium]|jgi:putative transcriptional regulator|nr:YqgE/AlgH family protein [Polyangiaceae bacterium]
MATTSLAPGFLLAAPRLGDPHFERTVVLLGHHNASGALGWILNGRPILPVHRLLTEASLVPPGVTLPSTTSFQATARVGGPVMAGSVWLLFERTPALDPEEDEHDLGHGFAATGSRAMVEAVARGEGPSFFHLVLGYAGWGPGQLEGEIQRGSWLPADIAPHLLRTHDLDPLWDAAYRTLGTTPLGFAGSTRGSA